jgi:hypothetical protein
MRRQTWDTALHKNNSIYPCLPETTGKRPVRTAQNQRSISLNPSRYQAQRSAKIPVFMRFSTVFASIFGQKTIAFLLIFFHSGARNYLHIKGFLRK